MNLFEQSPGSVIEHEADLELSKLVMKRDPAALRRFMDFYFPRLYRFALARMNYDTALAEEVVQDTLSIAARKMDTYRGEASLLTWMTQICRRELVRLLKKEQGRKKIVVLIEDDPTIAAIIETLQAPSDEEPFQNYAREDVIRLVQLSLDHLPDNYANALEWKYIEGLSILEIAEKMGIGNAAAESVLARARRSFRNIFKDVFESMKSANALNYT